MRPSWRSFCLLQAACASQRVYDFVSPLWAPKLPYDCFCWGLPSLKLVFSKGSPHLMWTGGSVSLPFRCRGASVCTACRGCLSFSLSCSSGFLAGLLAVVCDIGLSHSHVGTCRFSWPAPSRPLLYFSNHNPSGMFRPSPPSFLLRG